MFQMSHAQAPRILCLLVFFTLQGCGGSGSASPVTISLSDVSVTEGNPATFLISLSRGFDATITVDYATQDGTAQSGADYVEASGTFTFNPSQTTRNLVVSVIDDGNDEDDETFELILSNPSNAQLLGNTATMTIRDNDATPRLSFGVFGPQFVSDEGDSPTRILQVPIIASSPSGKTISVELSFVDESATNVDDFPANGPLVEIPPGARNTLADVMVFGDDIPEFDESFLITMRNPVNADLGPDTEERVYLYNDDGPPVTELLLGEIISSIEVSADGTIAVFQSSGSQFGDFMRDVYVYDRIAQATTVVPTASVISDCCSRAPRLSADGRFVIYESEFSDLVPGDTNNAPDTFLLDRSNDSLIRVSLASDGSEAIDGAGSGDVSDDGNFVAFVSTSNNLSPEDTGGVAQVFVKDLNTGTVELVSVDSGIAGDDDSSLIDISADGRFVLFSSEATNIVPGDTNGVSDLFLRDRINNTTQPISQGPNGEVGDAETNWGRMSSDANILVFQTAANNFVANDSDGDSDSFLLDRSSGALTRLSVDVQGTQVNTGTDLSVFRPTISRNGQFVTFTGTSPFPFGLNPGNMSKSTLYLLNRQTGVISEAAQLRKNNRDTYIDAFAASTSDDGRWIGYIAMTPGISRTPGFHLRGPFQ